MSLEHIENPSEDFCILTLLRDPSQLRFIENQTDTMCEVAVSKDPYAIEHVKNQSEALCWMAIIKENYAIVHVREPTDEMIEYVVKKHPHYLPHIHNVKPMTIIKHLRHAGREQLDEAARFLKDNDPVEIIQEWPEAIRLVDQTEELIYIALEHDPNVIQYIKDPTNEMIMSVIGKTPYVLVKLSSSHPDYNEICEKTIAKWPRSISYVTNPPYEMLRSVVKSHQHILLIHYSEELAWEALRDDTRNIRYIEIATNEMLEYVCDTNPRNLYLYEGYIPDKIVLKALPFAPELFHCGVEIDLPEDVMWKVLKERPDNIVYFNDPSDEMIIYAIRRFPNAFGQTRTPEELHWILLKDDPMNICVLGDEATSDMIRYAVERSHDALAYVPQTIELIEYALQCHPENAFKVVLGIADLNLRYEYAKRLKSC